LCIAALEYVGAIPYDILKPVLESCTAAQLYTLEDFNPVSLFCVAKDIMLSGANAACICPKCCLH